MSDDNHPPQQPHPDQGWQPLPQGGEYESEATAFVQLPEGFTTGVYGNVPGRYNAPGADPLAAPGHGYTPPSSFTQHAATPPVADAGTDPASTGQWTMPFADPSVGYADPSAGYPAHQGHAGHQDPAAHYQGGAPGTAQPWGGDHVDWPVAGSAEAAGAAGTWSVPAAADDGLEESGEYLVGDDGPMGYQGQAPHQEPVAADYQGGGYHDTYGGGAPADHGGAAGTGHWNFAAGPGAPAGGHEHGGAAVHDPFGAPAPAYPAADGAPADGGTPVAGDLYATGVVPTDAPAAGATGHWSLPADALAQWPPAPQEDAHRPETAAPGPDSGAGRWAAPAVEGEQPGQPREFAVPREADTGAVPAGGYGAYETYEEAPVPAAEERPAGGAEHPAQEADAHAPAGPDPVAAPEPDGAAGSGTTPAPEPAEAPHAPLATPGTAAAEPVAAAEPAGHTGEVAAPDGPPAVPAVTPEPTAPAADEHPHDEHPAASYVLRVNGTDRPVTDSWIGESLLYVLRERLGLAGAKDGCSQGECGACSVQVDGRLVASCLVPAATAAGSEVRTVEGLAQDGVPSDVQRALAASGAVQCGFCVPGMAMTVHDLLEGNHAPSEMETRKALCGNLCRCSGYRGVLDAVEEVVKARTEAAEAPDLTDRTPPDAPPETLRIPHQAGPSDPVGHSPHDQDSPGHHPAQGPGADPQTGGTA
ncbi:2Fe-2S iron-sulfur cluster-binding protein [Streptomyces sp. NPDC048638]|uniref:2Fe-2S iron-sulfur cluster-binding protein n=1 Tax=Streptomyces sp. NPDC048638 TaxID=3365580 RepID=UPI003721CF6B